MHLSTVFSWLFPKKNRKSFLTIRGQICLFEAQNGSEVEWMEGGVSAWKDGLQTLANNGIWKLLTEELY